MHHVNLEYLSPLSLTVVLSADRVEQMTKTYNDIDVVTHLLAEVSDWSATEKVLCLVFLFYITMSSHRGIATWSWPLGLVNLSYRGTTYCRSETNLWRSS